MRDFGTQCSGKDSSAPDAVSDMKLRDYNPLVSLNANGDTDLEDFLKFSAAAWLNAVFVSKNTGSSGREQPRQRTSQQMSQQ